MRHQRKVHQHVVKTFYQTCQNRKLGFGNSVHEDMEPTPGDPDDKGVDVCLTEEQIQQAVADPW